MPVIPHERAPFPAWSEVAYYAIHRVDPAREIVLRRHNVREVLFVVSGTGNLREGRTNFPVSAGSVLEWTEEELVFHADDRSVLVAVGGRWNDPAGVRGVFTLERSDTPSNAGDSAGYFRNTEFDRHFHDCDEFWVIVDGLGSVVTEGRHFPICGGMCVATQAGNHHDFPVVDERVVGVYLETSLRGAARCGHLWMHTHGSPHRTNDTLKGTAE